MVEIQNFLSQPIEVLAIIAFGYIGYRVSYVERVSSDDKLRVVFLTSCFALVAGLTFDFFDALRFRSLFVLILAFIATIGVAGFWRLCGMGLYSKFWGKVNSSSIDGLQSALDSIRLDAKFKPNQLMVQLTDGSAMFCNDLAEYKNEAFGPCIVGADGSISMYVTHYSSTYQSDMTARTGIRGSDGSLSTYIPASQIKSIKFRV